MQQIIVLAGANGTGKTTLYERKIKPFIEKFGIPYINPDAFASTLISKNYPLLSKQEYAPYYSQFALAAGRIAIKAQDEMISLNRSFVTETTLAGSSAIKLLQRAFQAGYRINLIFIGTNDPIINIHRVLGRVKDGGHGVTQTDIRRRYQSGLDNLPKSIRLANRIWFFDNSESRY